MKQRHEMLSLFSKIPLFSACQRETLSQLTADGTSVFLPSGDALDASFSDQLGVLLAGTAEILSADSGKPVILRSLRSHDVFGAASLFTRDEAPLSRIVATSPCHLLLLSRDAVRLALSKDNGFLDAFLTFLADRVSFLNRKIRCFTAGTAERRLALWLISEEQDTFTLPSLTLLSEMLDIGRASLYRALDKLKGEGLIDRNGHTVTLLDRSSIFNKYQ